MFDVANKCKTFEYMFTMSVLEIYCDELRDLLSPLNLENKLILKNGKNGLLVPGLTWRNIDNVAEAKLVSGSLLDILYVSSI